MVASGRKRKLLLVYPRFARNNLLDFEGMMSFYPGKRAVMPPLGLLEFAAVALPFFEVRFHDENVAPLAPDDLEWADIVAVSGMHPQRRRIETILEAANRLGKITVLGGPSVSICPEFYPSADAIHVGEIGDATSRLLEFLRSAPAKPPAQQVFETVEKTPIEALPLPALDVLPAINAYLLLPVQFSVGCPYTCEFCDIPVIYGRVARVKSGARVVAELQAAYDRGFVGTILFVDDNLIANRKALRSMLKDLVAWQAAHQYPYPITSEATINIARDEEILAQMQAARFTHLFLGIETADEETLDDISKRQNIQDPMIDSIRTIQSYGIEIIMGMIFGFDKDTPESGSRMTRFVGEAKAPIIYFNLLAALPKTPLWERMEREGRLANGQNGDAKQSEALLSCLTTNVKYKLDNDLVVEMLRATVRAVYSPEAVFARFYWNAEHVYGKQTQGIPPTRTRAEQWFAIKFSAGALLRVLWKGGVMAPWRGHFWRWLFFVARMRRAGTVKSFLEVLLRVTPNAAHLIEWGRVLLDGAEAEVLESLTTTMPAQRLAPATISPAPAPIPPARLTRERETNAP